MAPHPTDFGPLPKVDRNNEIQRLSIQALIGVLPASRFLPRDERADDFGVDFCLELLAPEGVTNLRAQVQLKGIGNASPHQEGYISLAVPTSNFNYLLNGPSPLYILYDVASRNLFYLWARDEQSRISLENPNWTHQKWVTLHFYRRITPDSLDEIYSRIKTEGFLYRLEKDNTELQVRHLICKCPDTLNALFEGRLTELPITKALLADNEIFRVARSLLSRLTPSGTQYEARFQDRANFLVTHPDARIVEGSKDHRYPLFETLRPPSTEELLQHGPQAIARCAATGVDPAELGIMVGLTTVKGDCSPFEGFVEYLRTRPVYVAFLALTNISDHPISLHELNVVRTSPQGIGYRPFGVTPSEVLDASLKFPQAGLGPAETVLIPEHLLMAPLEYGGKHIRELQRIEQETIVRTLSIETWSNTSETRYHSVGPSIIPRSIVLAGRGGQRREQPIYPLDLSGIYTFYTFDSRWEIGSCPHVFWLDGQTKQWTYAGAILTDSTATAPSETILELPTHATCFRVVELEEETTYLEQIELETTPGFISHTPIILRRGQFLEQELPQTQKHHRLRFTGRYVPASVTSQWSEKDIHARCELIANYLSFPPQSVASNRRSPAP